MTVYEGPRRSAWFMSGYEGPYVELDAPHDPRFPKWMVDHLEVKWDSYMRVCKELHESMMILSNWEEEQDRAKAEGSSEEG